MKIVEVQPPLIQHKLGLMRRAGISTKEFRELASEVAALLTYEATADMETEGKMIEGGAGRSHAYQGQEGHHRADSACRSGHAQRRARNDPCRQGERRRPAA